MHFASQAHRDKLNLELRVNLITTRCSSPLWNCYANQSHLTTEPVASQVPLNSFGLDYCEG